MAETIFTAFHVATRLCHMTAVAFDDNRFEFRGKPTFISLGPVFTSQRYACAVFAVVMCPPVRLSVCPVLYRNNWTNRAGFWHGSFL